MAFNITHQRLLPAMATLLVVSIVGLISLASSNFTNVELVDSPSLFSPFFSLLQVQYRVPAVLVAAYFIVSSSLSLGQLASRYKLYDRAYYIQLPLAAILSWGVAQSSEYLISSTLLFVVTRFVSSLFRAVRSDVSVSHIFDASLLLSVLPMLYTPSVVLWAIMPIFLLTISVTAREWIISVAGLMLAPMVALYVSWLRGGEFGDLAIQYSAQLRAESGILAIDQIPLFEVCMIAISLALSLFAIVLTMFSETHPRTKVRLNMLCLMVVASVASAVLPSASLSSVTLMVPALALLSALSLVRLEGFVVSMLYLLMLLLFFLDAFVPISLQI